jgi:ketosteroid isomerase-like protein
MKYILKNTGALLLVLIFCGFSFKLSAQDKKQVADFTSDSLAVVQTLNQFVDAFSNLEWEKFKAFFADSATAFFPPSAQFPYRANNKTEIETIFKNVFANARKQKSSPPYLVIEPKELKIQLMDNVAIASFTLDDPALLGRRTIVLKKINTKWLIVHLHASGAVIPK